MNANLTEHRLGVTLWREGSIYYSLLLMAIDLQCQTPMARAVFAAFDSPRLTRSASRAWPLSHGQASGENKPLPINVVTYEYSVVHIRAAKLLAFVFQKLRR